MTTTQTKTKYTPGPWAFDNSGFVYPSNNGQHPSEKDMICQFFSKSERDFDNCEANAKLIAAAPDLLEALKEMLRHTDGNCAELPTTTFSKAERNARAAIEKATP
jgi:hypothetical protein